MTREAAPRLLARRVDRALTNLSWVDASRSRIDVRGHAVRVEATVRHLSCAAPSTGEIEAAVVVVKELDPAIDEVALTPVRELTDLGPETT